MTPSLSLCLPPLSPVTSLLHGHRPHSQASVILDTRVNFAAAFLLVLLEHGCISMLTTMGYITPERCSVHSLAAPSLRQRARCAGSGWPLGPGWFHGGWRGHRPRAPPPAGAEHGRRIALASVIVDTRVNYAAVFLLVLFSPRALNFNGQRLLPPSRSRCASRSRR